MPDFIFDNTVLSNFAAIGKLDVLAELIRKNAYTTIEVVDELRRGIERGQLYLVPALSAAETPRGWQEILVLKSLEERLSCLVFAALRKMILVTDDLAARRLAARRDVRLTGTVGLLVGMIHTGLLPLEAANSLLEQMMRSGYRSPCARLDELI